MRILLHTGKGGVGKTTVSATTAIAAARRGYRTLVLSTDPAHSLADVLASPIGPDPDEVPGTPGLFAAQVDTRIRLEQAWAAIRQYLVAVLAARGMAEVQAEELTELPGAEEVLALLEVRRHAESGRFDAIVVDCAPSGETLRLLALPETVSFYVGRLMATPRRVLRSVAASLVGAGNAMPNGEVRDAVGDLLAELTAARTLLCDPETSSVRLVLTPERVVLAEARRLHTALTLHGYTVDGVVVNRVLPSDAGGRFLAGWRTAQRIVLHDISESFGAAVVHRIPMTATEPVGVVELGALAEGVFADIDPLAAPAIVPAMSVAVAGEGYRLLLPLPHVERSEIELARSGDDLVVTLGSVRRRIALPSVLRRCSVIGAELAGEELRVDFRPDPIRWPAALTDDGIPRVAVGGAG